MRDAKEVVQSIMYMSSTRQMIETIERDRREAQRAVLEDAMKRPEAGMVVGDQGERAVAYNNAIADAVEELSDMHYELKHASLTPTPEATR